MSEHSWMDLWHHQDISSVLPRHTKAYQTNMPSSEIGQYSFYELTAPFLRIRVPTKWYYLGEWLGKHRCTRIPCAWPMVLHNRPNDLMLKKWQRVSTIWAQKRDAQGWTQCGATISHGCYQLMMAWVWFVHCAKNTVDARESLLSEEPIGLTYLANQ